MINIFSVISPPKRDIIKLGVCCDHQNMYFTGHKANKFLLKSPRKINFQSYFQEHESTHHKSGANMATEVKPYGDP